jgi:hypothetical protein
MVGRNFRDGALAQRRARVEPSRMFPQVVHPKKPRGNHLLATLLPHLRWIQGGWFTITDDLPQYVEHATVGVDLPS